MSLVEALRKQSEAKSESPLVRWVNGLPEEDRVALHDALRDSNVSLSAVWRACRDSGAGFARETLATYRNEMLAQ